MELYKTKLNHGLIALLTIIIVLLLYIIVEGVYMSNRISAIADSDYRQNKKMSEFEDLSIRLK